MMRVRKIKSSAFALTVLYSSMAMAMESVSDDDLSDVAAQSGVTIYLSNPTGIGSNSTVFDWNPDNGSSTLSATAEVTGYQSQAIGAQGASTTNPYTMTITEDVGSSGTNAGLGLTANWGRSRTLLNSLKLLSGDIGTGTPSTYSFGQMAIDSQGSFTLNTTQGFLNSNATVDTNRQLRLTLGSPQFGVASPVNNYAQIYYRQSTAANSPEFVLDKVYLDTGFATGQGGVIGACQTSGTCGIFTNKFTAGSTGLLISTPRLDFNLLYSVNYRAAPSTALNTTGTDVLNGFNFGWAGATNTSTGAFNYASGNGGFDNAELLIGTGGFWTNPASSSTTPQDVAPTTRTQGLNIAFHADYDPTFAWYVGRDGAMIEFSNWTKIPGATWALNAPNITLDVIRAGQGMGGLCFGAQAYGGTAANCTGSTFTRPNGQVVNGQYLDTSKAASPVASPSSTALGLAIRDLSLQAYSTQVVVLDDLNGNGVYTDGAVTLTGKGGLTANESTVEPWTLMYTFGSLDANVYLYPGNGSSNGLTADVLFMAQSFKNGTNPLLNNTNLMIGDSSSGLAVGLTQANVLFAANQMQVNLNSTGIQLKSSDVRMEVQGRFAGGQIPAMTQPGSASVASNQVVVTDVDMNLESNKVDLSILPKTTSYNNPITGKPYSYLSFSGSVTLVSPGAPNNSSAPSATSLDITPTSGGCSTATDRSCDGSYFSLGEPSQPGVDVRFADLQGELKISSGQFILMSASDPTYSDNKPRLQLAETVQIGTTAGGNPLSSIVKFNNSSLGTIVIPSGQIYSSVMLKPQ